METQKPRWQYRFTNFSKAFKLLREAIYESQERTLSKLEEEGVIQRFEYTLELAWNTLKDYLENDGIVLEKATPNAIIKAAIKAKIIDSQEQWLKALKDRNQMSHIYNRATFNKVIKNIKQSYLSLFESVYENLITETIKEK